MRLGEGSLFWALVLATFSHVSCQKAGASGLLKGQLASADVGPFIDWHIPRQYEGLGRIFLFVFKNWVNGTRYAWFPEEMSYHECRDLSFATGLDLASVGNCYLRELTGCFNRTLWDGTVNGFESPPPSYCPNNPQPPCPKPLTCDPGHGLLISDGDTLFGKGTVYANFTSTSVSATFEGVTKRNITTGVFDFITDDSFCKTQFFCLKSSDPTAQQLGSFFFSETSGKSYLDLANFTFHSVPDADRVGLNAASVAYETERSAGIFKDAASMKPVGGVEVEWSIRQLEEAGYALVKFDVFTANLTAGAVFSFNKAPVALQVTVLDEEATVSVALAIVEAGVLYGGIFNGTALEKEVVFTKFALADVIYP